MQLQSFSGLSQEVLRLVDGSLLNPGQIRTCGVAVGNHEAPTLDGLPAYLDRWTEAYGKTLLLNWFNLRSKFQWNPKPRKSEAENG